VIYFCTSYYTLRGIAQLLLDLDVGAASHCLLRIAIMGSPLEVPISFLVSSRITGRFSRVSVTTSVGFLLFIRTSFRLVGVVREE
jgi:hypothetical protein